MATETAHQRSRLNLLGTPWTLFLLIGYNACWIWRPDTQFIGDIQRAIWFDDEHVNEDQEADEHKA